MIRKLAKGTKHLAATQRPWFSSVVAAGLVVAASATLFHQTRHFGLLGFDSYPILAASRVRSLADLAGTFTESLMGGYYPTPFYRPLVNLTFAADYALWGLGPAGYQLTDVFCFAFAALALYALARRLAGPGARRAPWVALAAFIFHPVLSDVVPIPARRSEMLCCALMLLALRLQLSRRALATRFPVWPAVVALAAILSKETAFVLPAVAFVATLLYVEERGPYRSALRATQALVPHAVVVVGMLALRSELGFIGVEGMASFAELMRPSFEFSPGLLASSPAGHWVLLAAAVTAIAGLALTLFGWAWCAPGEVGYPSLESLQAEIVPAAFLIAVLALTFGRANPWKLDYMYLLAVAGSALLAGSLCERAWCFARGRGFGRRLAAAAVLAIVLTPIVWQARYSPLVDPTDEGRAATAAARAFLHGTRLRIEEAKDGSVVVAPPLPRRVPPRDPLRSMGATILLDYSVQAWADVTFENRRVRVVWDPEGTAAGLAAQPDEVVVLLNRARPGF